MTSRKHHINGRRTGNHSARIRRRAYPQPPLEILDDLEAERKYQRFSDPKYGVRGTIQHKTEEQTKGKK